MPPVSHYDIHCGNSKAVKVQPFDGHFPPLLLTLSEEDSRLHNSRPSQPQSGGIFRSQVNSLSSTPQAEDGTSESRGTQEGRKT